MGYFSFMADDRQTQNMPIISYRWFYSTFTLVRNDGTVKDTTFFPAQEINQPSQNHSGRAGRWIDYRSGFATITGG
jgi:hypothetical protein